MDKGASAPGSLAAQPAGSERGTTGRACPSCAYVNPADHAFCGRCGQSLAGEAGSAASDAALPAATNAPRALGGSGAAELDVVRRYMPPGLLQKVLAARGKVEGERREVTVLVVDMQGYTALSEQLGEEVIYGLMNPIYELMISSVHQQEGAVQKLTGDGMLALFGAPVALEDAPVRACRAALDIQAQMERLGGEMEAQHGVRPRLRIGVHSGPVVVGTVGTDLRMEFEVVGDTVNLAARLQALAEPGTVVLSETTQRLVDGYAETTFVGQRSVKGKAAPQRVYRLDGLASRTTRLDVSRQRGLTRLVGRERELALLERCYAESRQGEIRLANVVGEAGLGKSRLLYELRQRVERDGTLVLQGQCRADTQATPFLPFIEIIRATFRLEREVTQRASEQLVRQQLEQLGVHGETAAPLLLNLLGLEVAGDALRGLDGEIIGARTRETLQALVRAWCQRGPTVFFVEDLHWIDTASEALLFAAIRSEERLPLLLVCTYRSVYAPPWAGRPDATVVALEPLSAAGTSELLRHRLGTDAMPDELVLLVTQKSEGNPLVAEEIVGFLLASGALQATGEGIAFRAGGDAQRIPTTLGNIVMARVDRLSETHRTVAQAASVIGRRFPLALLSPVAGVNGQLPRYVHDLEAQDLCLRLTEESDEYEFKHALVHDVIYDSLLQPRREALHQRAGQAIEQLHADRLGEWVDVLAHHYRRTPPEKAVYYQARAAEKSLRIYALAEAERRFRQAWDLLEAAPGCADDLFVADLVLQWARLYYYRKDFKGLIALLEPMVPRVEASGDRRRLALLLFWLGYSHSFGGRGETAQALLERSLALGEALGDDECIGYACMGLLWARAYWGRVFETPGGPGQSGGASSACDRLGERALAIAERLGDVYLASKCLLGLWSHRLLRWRYAEARQLAQRLVDLGRTASDARTVAVGLWALGFVNSQDERYEEGIANARESLRLSPDPLDQLTARCVEGMCLALMGRAEGVAVLRDVRRDLVAGDYVYPLTGVDIAYGGAMVLAGQMAAGVRWIEEAIERFRAWDNETQPPFGHLILGEIYLGMASGQEKPPLRVILANLGFLLRTLPAARRKARYHLEAATETARAVGMPGLLARSLYGLGLLCTLERRWAQARACLVEAQEIAVSLTSDLVEERIRIALESLPRAI